MIIVSSEGTRVDPRVTRLREKQHALQDKIERLLRRLRVGRVERDDDEEDEGFSSDSVEHLPRQHKRKERSHVPLPRRTSHVSPLNGQ